MVANTFAPSQSDSKAQMLPRIGTRKLVTVEQRCGCKSYLQILAIVFIKRTGRTDAGSPRWKNTAFILAQALRERRRPNSAPKPTTTNATLLGSGTAVALISYVSKRLVAIPGTPLVLMAGSV